MARSVEEYVHTIPPQHSGSDMKNSEPPHRDDVTAATERRLPNGGGGQMEREHCAMRVDFTMRN